MKSKYDWGHVYIAAIVRRTLATLADEVMLHRMDRHKCISIRAQRASGASMQKQNPPNYCYCEALVLVAIVGASAMA